MSLFKKKKEAEIEVRGEIPRLPELPDLPELPRISGIMDSKQEIHDLPSLPSENIGDIDNSLVKAAVSDSMREGSTKEIIFKPRTREISEREFNKKSIADISTKEIAFKPREEAIESNHRFIVPELTRSELVRERRAEEKGPLFIQIDKFEHALENFNEIKKRVNDIADMLKEVREIKQREDAELVEWEREIETIKSRIDGLDSEIFKKLY